MKKRQLLESIVIIHSSDYRQDWFDFRQRELEKYVIQNYFHQYLK
jgi:hypothetical protein